MTAADWLNLLQVVCAAVGAAVLVFFGALVAVSAIFSAASAFTRFVWDVAYEREAKIIAGAKREAEQIVAKARKKVER